MNAQTNKTGNYILKKLDSSYAIWFQNSKSFLQLEEPAYVVFKHFTEGIETEKITEICQNKFGHLEGNIPQFVDEIIQHIQYFNNPDNSANVSIKSEVSEINDAPAFCSENVYKLGDEQIIVKYGDEDFKFAIHPLIAHLEVFNTKNTTHTLECFVDNDLLIAKHNDKILDVFHKDKIEYFTGTVRQLMYSILHKIGYYEWMTMLHSSGISKNNKSVLFSATAGSGKTTISALLKAHGYGFLSDDFIAGDAKGKAYTFPAAISVKQGSVDTLSEFYPELLNTKAEKTFIGKSVRYIPVQNITDETKVGIPVKAFVFVQYSKKEKYLFEKVEKAEALQLLLKETWVNPEPFFVQNFFDWIENTPFYKLQYSTTEQALKTVQEIFET